MNKDLLKKAEEFAEVNALETVNLLKKMASVPAPSNDEIRRAEFVKEWLVEKGAKETYIDSALNVIYPVNDKGDNDIIVFMAHEDTVFPDIETIEITEKDGILYGPGIGDNASNLTNTLMTVKFLLENKVEVKDDLCLLFVASSGEEGLGNLKGSKEICDKFGKRIKEFIGLDGGMDSVTDDAVGSHRYKVNVYTEGGHSYGAFGNRNAIHYLSSIIQTLYMMQVPKKAKTTYNVGQISGGTSVNTIAESASMLYEFRSADFSCLKIMEDYFLSVIDSYVKSGIKVEVETLGIRPCKQNVDKTKHDDLIKRSKDIINMYNPGDIGTHASSTDSNIPLSMGIPAVTYGTTTGHNAHTRGESLEIKSLVPGQKIAIATVLQYCR